jgi:hypothetical protein
MERLILVSQRKMLLALALLQVVQVLLHLVVPLVLRSLE